jgi:hypothetical protein
MTVTDEFVFLLYLLIIIIYFLILKFWQMSRQIRRLKKENAEFKNILKDAEISNTIPEAREKK